MPYGTKDGKMTISVDAIELHDALLKSTCIDYTDGTVEIGFEFYASADDSSRKSVSVVFEGVESMSQIADLEALKKNAFAGNVTYWLPGENGATTYIYLTDGCLAIKAKQIRVSRIAP